MSNRDYYGDSVPNTGNEQQWPETNYAQSTSSQTLNQERVPQTSANQPDWTNVEGANSNAEGEKGLGATLVGGAGGAFIGHQAGKQSGHGTLGTVGGGIVGAVLANMAEHAIKDHHPKHGSSFRDRRRERLERKLERLG